MSERMIIIGAGGHGKVVADLALRCGYSNIYFVDDRANGECMGFPVVGRCADLHPYNDGKTDFVIAVGNNAIRKHIAQTFDLNWATLIHPSAQIGRDVTIGAGTVVMANAVVNACASVGSHCIINSGAIVEHDNVLGDFVHISPHGVLGGTVTVGEGTHVGIGCVVRNNIRITKNCVIGAGAVVVKELTVSGTYVGVPAKRIESDK